MFFGPLTVTVAADLIIDWITSKIGWRRVLWVCLENALSVVAFYLILGQLFELGLRGFAIAQIATLPKPILSVTFLVLDRRALPVQYLVASTIAKFAVFAAMFLSLLWLAPLD